MSTALVDDELLELEVALPPRPNPWLEPLHRYRVPIACAALVGALGGEVAKHALVGVVAVDE